MHEQTDSTSARRSVLCAPGAAGASILIGIDTVQTDPRKEVWSFETGGSVEWSSPTVVDDAVLIGSDDGNVYAVDAISGEEQWAFRTDSGRRYGLRRGL